MTKVNGHSRTKSGPRRRSATAEEQDALFFAPFGPLWLELPWSGPDGAEARLGAPERSRLTQARRTLEQSWLADPARAVVGAVGSMVRGTVAIHGGARARRPRWMLHDLGGSFSSDAQVLGNPRADMGRARLYALDGGDRFAERPVNITTLSRRPSQIEPLFELLKACSLRHQLRIVSYDEEQRLLAYFGLYRTMEEPAFTLTDHALLHALLPDLLRWLHTARVLGLEPLGETGLVAALECNPHPSYLIRRDGVVVFANGAARALPSPLATANTRCREGNQCSTRIRVQSEEFELLTLQGPTPATATLMSQLPAALRPVASELVAGLSDKDIAAKLDMPLATVRTYATRIYARTGVSSRRALMRLTCAASHEDGA